MAGKARRRKYISAPFSCSTDFPLDDVIAIYVPQNSLYRIGSTMDLRVGLLSELPQEKAWLSTSIVNQS